MKQEIPQRAIWGIGAAAVVVIGILIYLFRATDPAARGPIPYKKFDYGAHMQEQMREYNRQPTSTIGASPSNLPPSASAQTGK